MTTALKIFLSLIPLLLLSARAQAQTEDAQDTLGGEIQIERKDFPPKKTAYSPYVDQHFPQRVFFGDTHHHSSFSVDSDRPRHSRPG